MNRVRVRFAPSPTGPLHIGGVRTALFNYLFARKNNGSFILRIEDTDSVRYVEGAEKYIIESLKWCGLQFDEGIEQGGPFEPYRQSDRNSIYRQYADFLLNKGFAYYAFDKPEELDALRHACEKEGKTFVYSPSTRLGLCNSLSLTENEWNDKLLQGAPFVIRFKTPVNTKVTVHDIIRGEVVFQSDELDDKVLFKSDGTPTYHLANVVDDHLMEISHVIRGEEWLPSLPLHVMLYGAFEWTPPKFAHLPLILKPSGKGKLSKRDGDQLGFPVFPLRWVGPDGDISSGYREAGYFSEALLNFLVLLGWNPGDDQEIMNLDEMIQKFDLEKVSKSGSRFDPEKAKWFNHQYLIRKTDEEIATLFMETLREKGLNPPFATVVHVCSAVKERVSFVQDIWDEAYFYFTPPAEYDTVFVQKQWKPESAGYLMSVAEILKVTANFTASDCESNVKVWIEQNQLSFGKVLNPLRLAIVGAGKGPHIFDIISMIGKDQTLSRIKAAVNTLR